MTPDPVLRVIEEVLARPGEWVADPFLRHRDQNSFEGFPAYGRACPMCVLTRARGVPARNLSWTAFRDTLGLTLAQVDMVAGMADKAPWRDGYPADPDLYERYKAHLWEGVSPDRGGTP